MFSCVPVILIWYILYRRWSRFSFYLFSGCFGRNCKYAKIWFHKNFDFRVRFWVRLGIAKIVSLKVRIVGSIEFIIGWRLVWARWGIWAGANDKENWLGENEKFRECPRQVRAFHSKALIFSSQYTAKRFQISTPVSRKKISHRDRNIFERKNLQENNKHLNRRGTRLSGTPYLPRSW